MTKYRLILFFLFSIGISLNISAGPLSDSDFENILYFEEAPAGMELRQVNSDENFDSLISKYEQDQEDYFNISVEIVSVISSDDNVIGLVLRLYGIDQHHYDYSQDLIIVNGEVAYESDWEYDG